jgi:HD-like signal output (HDOD) protein
VNSACQYVQQLDTLGFPAAPAVILRLSQLLHTEWVTADELAEVAMLDTTVSARVLRVANSVYYRGRGVRSIAEAVIRIGMEGVRDIVYALSLMRTLRPAQFAHRQYWRHCLAVAQTTQVLHNRARGIAATPGELHAAGLLHDIGMLVLDRTLGVGYGRMLLNAHESGRPLFQVEREMLDTDHADVGAHLLERWQLPTSLIEATGCHHDPAGEGNRVAQVVYLADYICNLHAVHHGTAYRPENSAGDVWKALGLEENELPDILTEVDAGLEKADTILAASY